MRKPAAAPLVFSRLFLPQPLPPEQVEAFLTRLASDRREHVVVLETRADKEGIVHLIGCEATYVHELRRLLADLIPGTVMTGLDGYVRATILTTGTVQIKPSGLPLNVKTPEAITRAIYSTLARRYQPGEVIAVQVVLGPGVPPSPGAAEDLPAGKDEPLAGADPWAERCTDRGA